MFDAGFFPDVAKPGSFLADTLYLVKHNGISLKPSTALSVIPKTGTTVTVKAGRGMFNGYPFNLTEDLDIALTATASPQTFYIGVRLVSNAYSVPTGYSGDNVIAMTSFVAATDLVFGIVHLAASATTIITDDIDDTRFYAAYCGVIDQYDVMLEELAAEYQAGLDAMIAGGVPAHASTHAPGGSDPLTDVSATVAMLNAGGVFTGCAVTAQGTPNQTVAVSSGSIVTPDGKRYAVSAVSSLAATAADATKPRIDIVYITNAGVVTYLAGTAAASPAQPATPSNGTILAAIARAANDNTIATADITDRRDFITTANDFEDVYAVTESSNTFACDLAKKHTKNFSFPITNATGKTVTFNNVPYGTCDVLLTIKATGTAAVTWTLDGRTVVWLGSAPTLTTGYTYLVLFSYVPTLGKWIGIAQLGAAN